MKPTVNTKSEMRYKTAPEIELKSMRKTLALIRKAALKWQNEIHIETLFDDDAADDISDRWAAVIVRAIDRVV